MSHSTLTVGDLKRAVAKHGGRVKVPITMFHDVVFIQVTKTALRDVLEDYDDKDASPLGLFQITKYGVLLLNEADYCPHEQEVLNAL